MNRDAGLAYMQALEGERIAWEAVKDSLPGSGRFHPVLWRRWHECVQQAEDARREIRDQLASVPLRAHELERPGFYHYRHDEDSPTDLVQLLRTPTLRLVRFGDSERVLPLASLEGWFKGPLRQSRPSRKRGSPSGSP